MKHISRLPASALSFLIPVFACGLIPIRAASQMIRGGAGLGFGVSGPVGGVPRVEHSGGPVAPLLVPPGALPSLNGVLAAPSLAAPALTAAPLAVAAPRAVDAAKPLAGTKAQLALAGDKLAAAAAAGADNSAILDALFTGAPSVASVDARSARSAATARGFSRDEQALRLDSSQSFIVGYDANRREFYTDSAGQVRRRSHFYGTIPHGHPHYRDFWAYSERAYRNTLLQLSPDEKLVGFTLLRTSVFASEVKLIYAVETKKGLEVRMIYGIHGTTVYGGRPFQLFTKRSKGVQTVQLEHDSGKTVISVKTARGWTRVSVDVFPRLDKTDLARFSRILRR